MTEQAGRDHGVAGPVAPTTPAVCPWLGSIGDPATHYGFPSSAQVCHATRRPSEIAITKQARDCLTTRHPSCSRYRPVMPARLATNGPDPGQPPAASRRGGRRSRVIRLALLVILTAAIVVVGFAVGYRLGLAP